MRRLAIVFATSLLFANRAVAQRPQMAVPPDLLTKAELNAFRLTETYDETISFLERLAKLSPLIKLSYFGTSGQGRRLPLVVASKDATLTPESRWKSGQPAVLVLNSIHGGEVDGTDASLILLRDIALGNRPGLLDNLTLLVVPIYNVDGHERVSKYNRPNQDGPVQGMGFRTNARGLDLNRDFLKADAPETRALLSLAALWKPDLFIDDHVTDGADYQATLTLSCANEPSTPKPLADWLKAVVPKALKEVESWGIGTAPYIDFHDPLDPAKGIDPGPDQPRYSTGYFAIRNVPSILVETHSIKPYGERVKANQLFLSSLLTLVGADPKPLLLAREKARQETRGAAAGSPVVVHAETDLGRPEMFEFPAYAWNEVVSPVTGKPALRYDRERKLTLRIPRFGHAKPILTLPRPAAYIVPPGWPNIEERLKAHGLRYTPLPAGRTLSVGTYRAAAPSFAASPYQGRTRVTATISRAFETRSVPAGSLYVPLDTELALVAMHLLEPESPDSLFAWGELSTALEQKEYIDIRVLDPLAEAMLAKDPALKAAWDEKLKDPAFAGDPRARSQFFYSRTPFWDETVGLIPVYRLDAPLADAPAVPTAP
jgi:Zinc carboxypeptidase